MLQSATYDNGLGGEIFMNKYDAHLIETEDESGYIQKMYDPKMPIIINEHETNKWGSPRGYKVCGVLLFGPKLTQCQRGCSMIENGL